MDTTYSLTLTNEITNHFENILNNTNHPDSDKTITLAKANLVDLKKTETSPFIVKHIKNLEKMLGMLEDDKWSLSDDEKHYILSACQYLVEDNDVIPDDIPNIGLLDDCIIIDIASKKTNKELSNYNDFKHSKSIYAKNENFDVNDWQETKRLEAFSRLRNRRNKR